MTFAAIRHYLPQLLVPVLLCAAPSVMAASDPDDRIILKSEDGSIRIDGILKEYDGNNYTLTTSIGDVIIDAGNVVCEGGACPEPPVATGFVISGSATLARSLLPALLDGYSLSRDADVFLGGEEGGLSRITLQNFDGTDLADIGLATGGSSSGLRDLAAGRAGIALTTRPARPAELAEVARAGGGDIGRQPYETVVALDGLLLVTAPGNPVRAVSEDNIARIFAGRITNWSELGGRDGPIRLYGRAADTGTGAVFEGLILAPARLRMDPGLTVLQNDAAVADAVAADPQGIGFTSYSNRRGAAALAIRGSCGIQTPATPFTIKTEEYPLTRRLYAYRSERRIAAPAADFLTFVRGDLAQRVISRTGYVDQGLSTAGLNQMGLRFAASILSSAEDFTFEDLQSLVADLIAAERLSLTFRFENGSTRLDSRAEGDIARLADSIRAGDFENKELLLLGFTDGVGRADINAGLSRQRAEQVALALKDALGPDPMPAMITRGYGEMSPLGCNDTAAGRRINRRVEVWTRDIVN